MIKTFTFPSRYPNQHIAFLLNTRCLEFVQKLLVDKGKKPNYSIWKYSIVENRLRTTNNCHLNLGNTLIAFQQGRSWSYRAAFGCFVPNRRVVIVLQPTGRGERALVTSRGEGVWQEPSIQETASKHTTGRECVGLITVALPHPNAFAEHPIVVLFQNNLPRARFIHHHCKFVFLFGGRSKRKG